MHTDVVDDVAAVYGLNDLTLMVRTLVVAAKKFHVFLLFYTALRVIFPRFFFYQSVALVHIFAQLLQFRRTEEIFIHLFDSSYGDLLHRIDGLVGFLGDSQVSLLIECGFEVLRVLNKLKVRLRGGGLEFGGLMVEGLEICWRLLLKCFLRQLITHV